MKRILCIALAALALALAPGSSSAAPRHSHVRHHRHAARTAPADTSARVWVNTSTGIYHFEGERWYGKTEEGRYMTERQAIRDGYRATENGQ